MQHVEQAIQDKAAMEFILNTESERVEESIKSFLRSDSEDNSDDIMIYTMVFSEIADIRLLTAWVIDDRWSLIKFQNELYCNSGVAKKDPWHPQERPDPKPRGFVRTALAQICPDGARPTQFFGNFVRMGRSGLFFAQICPDSADLAS